MNFRSLDLNLLIVFEALLRLRSTTLAAEELSLTQSGVSNALKRLRAAFGDPLFVKTAQGMLPTERALQLAEPVRDGLMSIRGAVETSQDFVPQQSERTFRLYMSDIGQMIFIPQLAALLAEEAPGVRITTVAVSTRDAQTAMSMGEIDLAVGLFLNFSDGFRQQRLFRERYVASVREEHPTIRNVLNRDDFLRASHAIYRPTAGNHDVFEDMVDRWFHENGASRRVSVRLAHSMGLSALIAQTDLVVCVPSRLAHALGQRAYPLPFDSPAFDISQFWHKRFHEDAGHRWLRNVMFRLFHGEH